MIIKQTLATKMDKLQSYIIMHLAKHTGEGRNPNTMIHIVQWHKISVLLKNAHVCILLGRVFYRWYLVGFRLSFQPSISLLISLSSCSTYYWEFSIKVSDYYCWIVLFLPLILSVSVSSILVLFFRCIYIIVTSSWWIDPFIIIKLRAILSRFFVCLIFLLKTNNMWQLEIIFFSNSSLLLLFSF